MNGHKLQDLVHLFRPGVVLFGLAGPGRAALTNMLLMFGGCLNAIIGGFGKIFFMCGSLVMDLQCFLTISDMLGSFG